MRGQAEGVRPPLIIPRCDVTYYGGMLPDRTWQVGKVGPRPASKRMLYRPNQTTMLTPHIPSELLDQIVSLLRNSKRALMDCCLVSKSWVPHTRRHLFAVIRFDTGERLRSWKDTFPDPSTFPARYTKIRITHYP